MGDPHAGTSPQQTVPPLQPPLPPPPAGDATGGLIPYKNGPALAAYYLGVFSIIPVLGIVLGIAAVALGIAGLKKAARQPEVKGKAHAWVGIIVGGLFGFGYLVIAVAVVLVGATDLID